MKFTFEIDLSQDSMQTTEAVANAIRSVAGAVRARSVLRSQENDTIHAANGETVGKWEVTDTPADPIERMYDEAFAEPAPADGESLTPYTPLQLTTQALKDILNAAGNGQPYTLDELLSRFQNDYSVGAEELQRQGIPEIA